MSNRSFTRAIVGLALLTLLASGSAGGAIFENTSHEMASGDFFADGKNEVAYIQADGSIFMHDFNQWPSRTIQLPGGETAVKIVAADVNGDGRDDLGIVTSNALGLRTYDFATSTFGSVQGNSIQDLSSANIDADARVEIMVSTTSNAFYMFESGGFTGPLPGAGSALASGQFHADASEEFLTTGGGVGIYYYNGETNSWATYQSGGGNINRIAAGNVVPGDALDEVYLTNTSGNPYMTDGAGFVSTTGNGSDIGIGFLDADLGTQELAYIIGAGGAIFQSKLGWGTGAFNSGYHFLPVDPTSDLTPVANNSGFSDFIVADIDGDNLDELIARRGDSLFRFDNGSAAFVLAAVVPEPTTLLVWSLLAGLGFGLGWRRRK